MSNTTGSALPKGWNVVARALSIFWYLVAAALILWALLYVVILVMPTPRSATTNHGLALAFTYVVLFVLAFVAMFYGEGTEVAVAMLIDKDPEQIPEAIRPGFIALRSSHIPFISGRQLIVVMAIVGLTVLCLNVADVPDNRQGLVPFTQFFTSHGAREVFAILFPTFFALWFIQLPPKFMAHTNPLGAYSWQLTRAAVYCSLFLGKWLRVEGPSQQVTALLARLQPSTPEVLRPSRENYYKLSATLRDGRAQELDEIDMFVDKFGAVRVIETLKFKAFARGFRHLYHQIGWEAPLRSNVVVTEFGGSENCTVRGPRIYERANAEGKKLYWNSWHLELKESLPLGAALAFLSTCQTDSNATRFQDGEQDYLGFSVDVPAARIIFRIQPEEGAPFTFVEGRATAKTSPDAGVNEEEAKLVNVVPYGPEGRGYRFCVDYPLLGTKLRFHWKVQGSTPAPAPLPGSPVPLTSVSLVTYLPAKES